MSIERVKEKNLLSEASENEYQVSRRTRAVDPDYETFFLDPAVSYLNISVEPDNEDYGRIRYGSRSLHKHSPDPQPCGTQ